MTTLRSKGCPSPLGADAICPISRCCSKPAWNFVTGVPKLNRAYTDSLMRLGSTDFFTLAPDRFKRKQRPTGAGSTHRGRHGGQRPARPGPRLLRGGEDLHTRRQRPPRRGHEEDPYANARLPACLLLGPSCAVSGDCHTWDGPWVEEKLSAPACEARRTPTISTPGSARTRLVLERRVLASFGVATGTLMTMPTSSPSPTAWKLAGRWKVPKKKKKKKVAG